MVQKTLFGTEITDYNYYYVYSKRVKEGAIKSTEIRKNEEKRKLSEMITSLLRLGREKGLDDLEIKENCREWVIKILEKYPSFDKSHLKYLINDFTDHMMTRMREEGKYAIAIVYQGMLLLCHSAVGEKTMTPSFQIIERMLDKDNVDRFVAFKKENDQIKVIYWEHYPSGLFIRWLGITGREASYYLGGKNRFYTEIEGLKCAIELSDEEVEEKLVESDKFKFENNTLILPSGYSLVINQIRTGKKYYKNYDEFLEEFMFRRYNLTYYSEQYTKINNSLDLLYKKFVDEKDKLIEIENSKEKTVLRKRNPNFTILFANKHISIRQSFLNELFTNYLNNTKTKIFHAGMKFSQKPLKIGPFEFYNKIETNELISAICEFLEKSDIKDKSIYHTLSYTILQLLKNKNQEKPISYFLEKLSQKFIEKIDLSQKIMQQENTTIEFKSRDIMVGSNDQIVMKLTEDIKKKMKDTNFKIYIIGVDEKTQTFEPIKSSKLPSDRVTKIEQKIRKQLKTTGKFIIKLIKIPSRNREDCIIIIPVQKLNNNL